MHSFPQTNSHKCQIDCTNHDQVINKLQVKSKDLYYFWRNYEWLYNKYYTQLQNQRQDTPQQKPNQIAHKQCILQKNKLEQQLHSISQQMKKIKYQNTQLKKQLSSKSGQSTIQNDYKKQISRLKSQCSEYEQFSQKLQNQMKRVKLTYSSVQAQLQQQKIKAKQQKVKDQQMIIDLQKTIDQLRLKLTNISSNVPVSVLNPQRQATISMNQVYEKSSRQSIEVRKAMSQLYQQTQIIVHEEMQLSRNQCLKELQNIIANISIRDMQSLIVDTE